MDGRPRVPEGGNGSSRYSRAIGTMRPFVRKSQPGQDLVGCLRPGFPLQGCRIGWEAGAGTICMCPTGPEPSPVWLSRTNWRTVTAPAVYLAERLHLRCTRSPIHSSRATHRPEREGVYLVIRSGDRDQTHTDSDPLRRCHSARARTAAGLWCMARRRDLDDRVRCRDVSDVRVYCTHPIPRSDAAPCPAVSGGCPAAED
jgi:hypothetical protein